MPRQQVLHAVDAEWMARMIACWSTRSAVYTNEYLGIDLRMVALLAERLSTIHQLVTMGWMALRYRLCHLYPLLVDQSLADI
jgi:hypothetical protein